VTLASNALVFILGGLSLFEDNAAFFKLQPAIMILAFALFILGSSWLGKPLLLEIMKKQGREIPEEARPRLEGFNRRLGWCMVGISLVGVHAAFYWSTSAWAAFKAMGVPILLGLYMGVEVLVAKKRRRH
jgi:intracellular septation protein A